MEHKGLEVKLAGDQGQVQAVFSRFNVIDHDGDVTVPGAFTDGQKVRISAYNHGSWGGALPVGKGTITQNDEVATMEGQFFMNTAAGADTFEVVKQLEDLGEWSYGFDVVEASHGQLDGQAVRFLKQLSVTEVSPVLLGAGIGTGTVATKSQLPLNRTHVWDEEGARERIAAWAGGDTRKAARAFFWGFGRPGETMSDLKLPFADIVDGTLTAIWGGVTGAADAILHGRGGVDIPEADLASVKGRIDGYFRKASAQFDDKGIKAPWEKSTLHLTDAELMTAFDAHLSEVKDRGLPFPDGLTEAVREADARVMEAKRRDGMLLLIAAAHGINYEGTEA